MSLVLPSSSSSSIRQPALDQRIHQSSQKSMYKKSKRNQKGKEQRTMYVIKKSKTKVKREETRKSERKKRKRKKERGSERKKHTLVVKWSAVNKDVISVIILSVEGSPMLSNYQ